MNATHANFAIKRSQPSQSNLLANEATKAAHWLSMSSTNHSHLQSAALKLGSDSMKRTVSLDVEFGTAGGAGVGSFQNPEVHHPFPHHV